MLPAAALATHRARSLLPAVARAFCRRPRHHQGLPHTPASMAPKRAPKPAVDDDDVDDVDLKAKPKAKRAKKADMPTGPFTDELGWNIVPPGLEWK